MKNLIVSILFCLPLVVYSQHLESCEKCHEIKYTEAQISENELYELKLLRNELFARHHYTFENERLTAYFSDFDWYEPNYELDIKEIVLNETERHNVQLFLNKQHSLDQDQAKLINEFKTLKHAMREDQSHYLDNFFLNYDEANYYTKNLVQRDIQSILNKMELKQVHWFKGKVHYTVKIDNGYAISTYQLIIDQSKIALSVSAPGAHSKIMTHEEAFSFPSTYHSEEESYVEFQLEYKYGKLMLVRVISAG